MSSDTNTAEANGDHLDAMRPIFARSNKPAVKEKISACFLCAGYCGVVLSLDEDDHVVKVVGDKNNPNTKGFICNKGVNLYASLDSPFRLTKPLKRIEGELRPVTWDDALNDIAARLRKIRKENGARSIGMAFGGSECQSPAMLSATMLMYGLGSRSIYSPAGLEFLARFLVAENMYGHAMMDGHPDFENTQYCIIVGSNPLVSCPPKGPMLKAMSSDAERTLVVVDPRRSETAEIADKYFPINPSADVYFLFAILNILVGEGLYDKSHVEKHSRGIEELAGLISVFTPEVAERFCGIKTADIETTAREFAAADSGLVYYHMGVIANHHATLVAWAVQTIKFITNNKGRKGGSLTNPTLVDMNKLQQLMPDEARYSSRTQPGLGEIGGCLPTTILADEILTPGSGQIKAMIVASCNPLRGYGEGGRMEQAFDGLELLVSIDPFLTEVGRKADFVLPSCAYWEQENIAFAHPWMFKTPFLQLAKPVRAPRGDSWPEWKIYRELLHRAGPIGLSHRVMHWTFYCFEKIHRLRRKPGVFNRQTATLKLLARFGSIDWQDLENKPHGYNAQRKQYDYLANIGTKDGRVALAIPEFIAELQKLPLVTLNPDREYPLRLSTVCRSRSNTNTMFHNALWQAKHTRDGDLKIHPDTAAKLAMKDGDEAHLQTASHRSRVSIHITDVALPGSAHLSHGWGLMSRKLGSDEQTLGVEAGRFASQDEYDALTGMPVLTGIPCRLDPVDTP